MFDTRLRPGLVRLSSAAWAAVAALEKGVPAFAGLSASLTMFGAEWRSWSAALPSHGSLPGSWSQTLTAFQHLLLVKVLMQSVF